MHSSFSELQKPGVVKGFVSFVPLWLKKGGREERLSLDKSDKWINIKYLFGVG